MKISSFIAYIVLIAAVVHGQDPTVDKSTIRPSSRLALIAATPTPTVKSGQPVVMNLNDYRLKPVESATTESRRGTAEAV